MQVEKRGEEMKIRNISHHLTEKLLRDELASNSNWNKSRIGSNNGRKLNRAWQW